MEIITVYIKERKIYIFTLVIFLFLILSVYEFLYAHEAPFNINTTLIKVASVVTFVVFGFIFSFCLKVIIKGRKGFIAGEKGLFDNSSVLSAGFIPWSDIESLCVRRINNTDYLLISLKNITKYKQNENEFIAKVIDYNIKNFNVPIVIHAKKLRCNIYELEKNLIKLHQNFLNKIK